MSKEKRRVPKLRFPGFTEDWEQRKLCQITTRVTRKNGDQSDLPLTISAQDGLVDQRKYFNRQVASRDMSNYYLIKKGEFAYNKSYSEGYPFGAVKRLDYYDIGALSTLYILFEITDNNISSDFIVSYYMTHLWYKEISKRAAEGARNHGLLNISTEDFFDSELNIPNSIEEQVKIGNFIKQFDKFITLHQCKLKKLNLAKKSLLQKLFPRNGSQIPGVRFKGFTDAWEQRKLESLFTKYEDKVNTPDSGYWRLGLRSHCKGTFHTYVDAGHELETTEMYRVKAGNFILNITFAWERALAVTDDEDQDKLVSHRFPQFKPNSDLVIDFFKHTLMDKRLKHHLELSSPGGAGRNKVLKVSDMLKYELLVPSIQEQNIISSFLNNIDHIITLHQRKLERLQEVKKGLLQKMFV